MADTDRTGERCEHTLGALRCVLDRDHDRWHICTGPSPDDGVALTGPSSTPTPEMLAQAAALGAHDGPALMVRPAVPVSPSDATIANLARAHTASIMEWNRAHATTEPSHEDAMAIFERRDRTLFALLDALHPGWREVYEDAWGEDGRARRAAARAGVEGEVSP